MVRVGGNKLWIKRYAIVEMDLICLSSRVRLVPCAHVRLVTRMLTLVSSLLIGPLTSCEGQVSPTEDVLPAHRGPKFYPPLFASAILGSPGPVPSLRFFFAWGFFLPAPNLVCVRETNEPGKKSILFLFPSPTKRHPPPSTTASTNHHPEEKKSVFSLCTSQTTAIMADSEYVRSITLITEE